jgi:hypothetical protein
VNTSAVEECNTIDDNCDGNIDEGFDMDGDGATVCQGDCDDFNANVSPFIAETCDGIDNDCNGVTDEGFDQDFDGFTTCQNDCDDLNDLIFPGGTEICDNGIDEDCNGADLVCPVLGCTDITACNFNALATQDDASCIFPAAEICGNGIDEDCSGSDLVCPVLGCTDITACNYNALATQDDASCIFPAAEICGNGIDEDCDGSDLACTDILGCTDINACNYDLTATQDDGSCIFPAAEICGNGIDEDCDGADLTCPVLGCTDITACNYNALATQDDASCIYPTTEICDNAIDEDCDGVVNISATYYSDNDGDGFGDVNVIIQDCVQPVGYVMDNTDCDDADFLVNPSATEECNTIDDNCNGNIDEGFDLDADGVTSCNGDCDDNNNAINSLAVEICDGLDNDCNGGVDEGFDQDFDGFTTCQNDCDDLNDQISPSGTEICDNGIDEDCDGSDLACVVFGCTDINACNYDLTATQDDGSCVYPTTEICDNAIDEDCDGAVNVSSTFFADNDGDGFGDASISVVDCVQPAGYVVNNADCDDTDFLVNPLATEECNTIDDNCDGNIDEGFDLDADGVTSCNGDCNDINANIFDGNTEICDGLDNDCNGVADEGFDQDGDGFTVCAGDCDDLNDQVFTGATEICGNGIDEDCDGVDDAGSIFYADADGDGFGDVNVTITDCNAPSGYVADNTDCNDLDLNIYPGALEVCGNGIDEDCDGADDIANTFYADVDGDGFGNPASPITACNALVGYVVDNTDCDDAIQSTYPGAPEVCGNGIDEDCDGSDDVGNTFYADVDGDGFGDAASTIVSCNAPTGYVADNTDCNDALASAFPGGIETCGNGIDEDCNGSDLACTDILGCTDINACNYDVTATQDDGSCVGPVIYYADNDGDGFGDGAISIVDCIQPAGFVTDNTDCADGLAAINPAAAEICNGFDDNCDNTIDEGFDQDGSLRWSGQQL